MIVGCFFAKKFEDTVFIDNFVVCWDAHPHDDAIHSLKKAKYVSSPEKGEIIVDEKPIITQTK